MNELKERWTLIDRGRRAAAEQALGRRLVSNLRGRERCTLCVQHAWMPRQTGAHQWRGSCRLDLSPETRAPAARPSARSPAGQGRPSWRQGCYAGAWHGLGRPGGKRWLLRALPAWHGASSGTAGTQQGAAALRAPEQAAGKAVMGVPCARCRACVALPAHMKPSLQVQESRADRWDRHSCLGDSLQPLRRSSGRRKLPAPRAAAHIHLASTWNRGAPPSWLLDRCPLPWLVRAWGGQSAGSRAGTRGCGGRTGGGSSGGRAASWTALEWRLECAGEGCRALLVLHRARGSELLQSPAPGSWGWPAAASRRHSTVELFACAPFLGCRAPTFLLACPRLRVAKPKARRSDVACTAQSSNSTASV